MSDAATHKPIAGLKSAGPLRAMVDEAYKDSVVAMAEGKPTAWAMANWWHGSPILKAMGIETVYPENYGAVCAATGTAQRYLEISDAAGYPTHLCGYMRVNFGYTHRMMRELDGQIPPEAPMGGMARPMLLLGSSIVCDPRYKWFQALGRYLDAPIYNLEMPNPGTREFFREGVQEQSVRLAVQGTRDFIAFLENLVGRRMDEAKLAETVDDMLTMLRIWYEINELRRAKPCPMHARHFWTCMPPALFMLGDVKKSIVLYSALYQELKGLIAKGSCAVAKEKYRLGWAELPPWHSLNFFDALADRGWNFVTESVSYHPPIPTDMSHIADPVEKIARNTLQWYTGRYGYAEKTGGQMGFMGDCYGQLAEEFELDGLVMHQLLTCRTASNHLAYAREVAGKRLNVPSMMVQGDIVDFTLFDPRETLRAAEAFEEVMEHHRAERRREGRGW